MSAVVECPACHESLELPDEFIEGVVCPHCEAAFVLKPVLLNDAGEPIEEQPAGSAAPSVLPPPESSPGSEPAAGTAPASEPNQEVAAATKSEVASEGDVTSEGEAPAEASASSSGLRFAALAAAGDSGSKDEGNIAVAAAGAEAAAAASESKAADAEQETKAAPKSVALPQGHRFSARNRLDRGFQPRDNLINRGPVHPRRHRGSGAFQPVQPGLCHNEIGNGRDVIGRKQRQAGPAIALIGNKRAD